MRVHFDFWGKLIHHSPDDFTWSWWRHQMETFSALLAICAGNSPVPGEFPTQRPVTRSFDVYFDLRPNKRLSKQSWGWWFEPQSRPLWHHRNVCKQAVDDTMPSAGTPLTIKRHIFSGFCYKFRQIFFGCLAGILIGVFLTRRNYRKLPPKCLDTRWFYWCPCSSLTTFH